MIKNNSINLSAIEEVKSDFFGSSLFSDKSNVFKDHIPKDNIALKQND